MVTPSGGFEVGGEQVSTHNDGHFARMRAKFGVEPSFLAKFDFKTLRMFGGKGGNLMAFTKDKRFLVKELNKGDHASMLSHVVEVLDRQMTGDSLLCQLFLHFARGAKNYLVMRNVLPTGPSIIWHKRYDLKGNRDDKLLEDDGGEVEEVHKRCFDFHKCWYGCDVIPFCTTPARKRYYEGKKQAFSKQFVMTSSQAARVIGMLKGDADMLGAAGVMDYSLIVGIIRQGMSDPIPPADGLNQFVVSYGGWTYIYYLGVIDFLQEWTSTKKIAALIKAPLAPKPLSTVPPLKYALQFSSSFDRKFINDSTAVVRI